MPGIPESDWRLLNAVHAAAVERYCERVVEECERAIRQSGASAHERYLELYGLIQDHDEQIAGAFNDMRRSQAVLRLAAMINLGVVTDEELAAFTDRTREAARNLAELNRPRPTRRRPRTAGDAERNG